MIITTRLGKLQHVLGKRQRVSCQLRQWVYFCVMSGVNFDHALMKSNVITSSQANYATGIKRYELVHYKLLLQDLFCLPF